MFQDGMRNKVDDIRGLRTADVLAALGLARRRSLQNDWLPAIGLFAAGVVVGTGVALLLTPKSGSDIRRGLRNRASNLADSVGGAIHHVRGVTEDGGEDAPSAGARIPKTENGDRTQGAQRTAVPK